MQNLATYVQTPKHAGGVISRLLISALVCVAAAASAWGTYTRFAVGLSYVTTPIGIAFGVLVVAVAINPRWHRSSFCTADLLCVFFYLSVLASYFWSLDRTGWPNQIFWYTICIISYLCARYGLSTRRQMWIFCASVVLGVIIATVLLGDVGQGVGNFDDRRSIGELNSNFTAYVLAGSLYILVVAAKLFARGVLRYAILFFSFSVVVIDVTWLGTRGAILACGGLFLWLVAHRMVSGRLLWFFAGSALLLVLIIAGGMADDLVEFIGGISVRPDDDLGGRIPIWAIAAGFVKDHWITGIGAGAFVSVNPIGIGAHNILLTLLLDSGAVGLALFLTFFYYLLAPGFSAARGSDKRFVVGAFFAYLIPIAFTGHWELAPFSWVILGFTHNALRLAGTR